jgi:hypothetical protein
MVEYEVLEAGFFHKSKPNPLTGRGGLLGCERLRIQHCLDNRLIDGGKVVSATHQPQFTAQKLFLMFPVLISFRG